MNIILGLFRDRDTNLCRAYDDIHSSEPNFTKRKKSEFLSENFVQSLWNDESVESIINVESISSLHRLYVAFRFYLNVDS